MSRLSVLKTKFTELCSNLRSSSKWFARGDAIGWAIAPLVIIAGAWLWQVLGQFTIGLIGQSSSFTIWSLWWLQRAIWLNYDWMITDYVVTPFQQNLLLFLSPIDSLIYAVLRGLQLSAPMAFNLLYIISILFTGWSMFAYLGHCQVTRSWASFCALLWAFSPVMTYHLFQGRPDLMALGWIPLGCWAWDVMRTHPHPKRLGWRLALIGLGVIFTSVQLTVSALAVWLPYVTVGLLRAVPGDRRWLFNSVLWQALVVLAVVMVYPLPGILKTLAGLAPKVQASALLPEIWQWSAGIILMLLLWVGLIGLVSLSGSMLVCNRVSSETLLVEQRNDVLTWASISGVTLLLALVTAWGWLPELQTWLLPVDWLASASVGCCWLIAVCLPLGWRSSQIRNQALRSVLASIPIGILMLAIVLQRTPPIMLWEHTDTYAAISQELGDYAVLEVPFGLKSLSSGQTFGDGATLQQYAAEHHKRSLNGMLTRDGQEVFQHYTTPLLRLLAGESVTPNLAITAELKKLIQQEQIGYLVVHPEQLTLAQRTVILNFLNAQPQFLCKVFTDSVTVVYRTFWHPFGCSKMLGSLPTPIIAELEMTS